MGERNLCLGEKKMHGRKVVERESGLIFSIDQISPSHGTLVTRIWTKEGDFLPLFIRWCSGDGPFSRTVAMVRTEYSIGG